MADNGSLRGTPTQNYGGFANAAGSFAVRPTSNLIDRAKAIQGIFSAYNPLGANPAFRSNDSHLPMPQVNPVSSNLDFSFSSPSGDPLQVPINFVANAKGYPNLNFVQNGFGLGLALSINKQFNTTRTLVNGTGFPLFYAASGGPTLSTPDGGNSSITLLPGNVDAIEKKATGETYKYVNNFITRIQSAAGSIWTTQYDGSQFTKRVLDSSSRITSFTWSKSGNNLIILDPSGRCTSLIFNVYGPSSLKLITGIQYPDGLRYSMTYRNNSFGNAWTINRLIYPSGGLFTNRYEFLGTSAYYDVITPLSQRMTYLWRFSSFPYKLRITNSTPNITTHTYIGVIPAGPYNIRVEDPKLNITTFLHDGVRPGTIIDPLGSRATISYKTMTNTLGDRRMSAVTLPTGGRFTFDYDSNDRVKQLFEENGNRSTLIWDGNGNRTAIIDVLQQRTSFTYNSLNQVQSEINPLLERTTSVYNSLGQVIAQINPLGYRTTNTYSTYGQLILQEDPLNRITSMQYDVMNRLTRMTDPAGGRTLYFYDVNGTAIQSVVNPANERRTYLYDLAGQLKATIDPMLGRTTYGYDPSGNVTSVTNPENETTTHRYDACNRRTATLTPLQFRTSFNYNAGSYLTSTNDPDGSTTQVRYTVDGRVKATFDGNGNRTSYTYDIIGNRVSSLDPLLNRTTYFYDQLHRMTGMLNAELERTTFQYDAANRRVAVINPMRETITYRYDKAGQLRAEIMPNGGLTTYNYDPAGQNYRVIDPNGNITTTAYDLLGRPIYRVDANTTNRWSTVYDAVGRVTQQIRPSGSSTQYAYDKLGRRIRSVDPTGAIWTSVYDKVGRLLQQIDPRRMTTTYRYDLDGRRVQTKTPLGFISTSVYDSDGSLISSVDQENFRTTYSYDADHQLVRTTDPHLYLTSYVYDAGGRQIIVNNAELERVTTTYDKVGRVVKTVDPLSQRTTLRYDKVGRVTREILVNSGINTYAYDINGNLRRRINAVANIMTSIYDIGNRQVASIDGEGNRWSTTYDALNRISRTVDPLLNVNTSRYDVDGRLASSIDANSARTTFVYDSANRRIRILDANNKIWTTAYDVAGRMTGTIPPSLHRTTYAYDNDNRTIAVADPNNNRISYVYDKRGLRRSIRFPSPQPPVTYAYDGAGWRSQRTDGRGNRTTYTFDKVGRETLWDYPSGPSVSFVYDDLGRIVDRTDRSGRYTTTYWPLGQILNERHAGTPENVGFAVDSLGRRTLYSANYPVGQFGIYTYDKNDRTKSYFSTIGGDTTTFDYDSAGRRIITKRPNNTRTSVIYDKTGRTAEIFHFSTSGTYTPLASLTYTYDPVGNPIRLVDSGSSVVTWTYDADYQLRREYRTGTASYVITHVYDPAGNRTAAIDSGARTTFVYDPSGQIRRTISASGIQTLAYDADGNLTSQAGFTSKWDEENRLVGQSIGSSLVTTMAYDFAGRKRQYGVSVLASTVRSTYIWDHWNVQQIAQQVTPTTLIFDLEPRQYGQVLADASRTGKNYYHYDAIDSTILRTNLSSGIYENSRYTGYGNLKNIAGAQQTFGWIGGQGYELFGFPTPAYYIRQRYYSPTLARWWGRDPLNKWYQLSNQYAYADRRPILLIDPSGLACVILNAVPAGNGKWTLERWSLAETTNSLIAGTVGSQPIAPGATGTTPPDAINKGILYEYECVYTRPIIIALLCDTWFCGKELRTYRRTETRTIINKIPVGNGFVCYQLKTEIPVLKGDGSTVIEPSTEWVCEDPKLISKADIEAWCRGNSPPQNGPVHLNK